jgi:hypothetical protein
MGVSVRGADWSSVRLTHTRPDGSRAPGAVAGLTTLADPLAGNARGGGNQNNDPSTVEIVVGGKSPDATTRHPMVEAADASSVALQPTVR